MNKINLLTDSYEDTMKLGFDFSKNLEAGDIVGLIGDLSAGKTTFIKGILKGLGYKYTVSSPTFTLINNYEAELDVMHVDFYREKRPERWRLIGLDEYLYSNDCITIIEWGNLHLDLLPEDILIIKFSHMDENKRKIKIGL